MALIKCGLRFSIAGRQFFLTNYWKLILFNVLLLLFRFYFRDEDCLGNIYFQRRRWDEARDYYEKSLTLMEKLKDERGIESSLGNLGLGDGAWIDGTRPIVIRLPQQGLMNMGWVGALPVKERAGALEALEVRLGPPEKDGDLLAFVSPDNRMVLTA